jgi:hypothetical protein
MKHSFLYPTALMLLLAGATFGQATGEIHGKVLDREGNPLFMANVYVERGEGIMGTTSDEHGRFVLKPLGAGLYTVRISYVGMVTHEAQNVQVNADKIARLGDIVLQSREDLPEVVIVAYIWEPPLIDVAEPTKITVVAAQLKDNPLRKDPIAMIATLSPDIYKAPGSDELYFRGSRSDAMAYFVDGVKVTGSLTAVPPASIGSITLYTGGLPARYGDVTGGVVAIETKSYFDLYMQAKAGLR